jgi:hypothetical protein
MVTPPASTYFPDGKHTGSKLSPPPSSSDCATSISSLKSDTGAGPNGTGGIPVSPSAIRVSTGGFGGVARKFAADIRVVLGFLGIADLIHREMAILITGHGDITAGLVLDFIRIQSAPTKIFPNAKISNKNCIRNRNKYLQDFRVT